MNRALLILAAFLCFATHCFSQNFDGQRLSERDLQGSARYVGMAGAFTSLGGDVSAVNDNPAALGVFRRGEVSGTLDVRLDDVSTGSVSNGTDKRMTLPQLAWVISFGHPEKQQGAIYHNLILSYHRLKTYNRNSNFNTALASSQTDLIARLTDGLSDTLLQGDAAWNNEEIGWLSKLGYEGYLIDPVAGSRWQSVYPYDQSIRTVLDISEAGVQNEYTLGWGMNYSNCLYIGASAAIRTLQYSRATTLTETFENLTAYQLYSSLTAQGWGINAAAGVIWRPADYIRLGVSLRTPTLTRVNFRNYSEIKSGVNVNLNTLIEISTPVNSYSENRMYEPMRLTAGIAFVLAQKALLSLEYDYDHASSYQLADVHFMKFGMETAIKNNWFVRAGYACQSPFAAAVHYYPHYADTRTDTDYQNHTITHFFNVGAGWRNNSWLVDIAYQCRWQHEDEYAYYMAAAMPMDALTHRLVFSFGWTYRR